MSIEYTESQLRLYEKLCRDLGNTILQSLEVTDINEIMVNPDGKMWIDSSKEGLVQAGELLPQQVYSIIYGVAGIRDFVVSQHHPRLEADLPCYKAMKNERFTAQIPPIVSGPSFTIRKRSESIFKMEDYIQTGRMSKRQADVLRDLIKERKNILVCGGPGSGKTTVTNALIIEAINYDKTQRFLILEDLPELQCKALNVVAMLTTNDVSMTALLRSAMRMRPDRILIGEVRGKEALDMLKAWNTGCPGGICTVHANGAEEAIQRILDLSMESGLIAPPLQLLSQTIDAVVSVTRQGNQKGFIHEILSLKRYQNGKFDFEKLD